VRYGGTMETDRNKLERELMALGFYQVRTKDAANWLGVSMHTLQSVLQGRRSVPEWLMDRVRQRKEGQ